MSRSVVLAGTDRCGRCLLPPRWCVCDGLDPVVLPFPVDILQHRRERGRPTSTGLLIGRTCTGATVHPYRPGMARTDLVGPSETRALWILHPRGDLVDPAAAGATDPGAVRVVLLDGSWSESGRMARAMEGWGRRVRLPDPGPGRYLLRDPGSAGCVSTAEALIVLLDLLGFAAEASALRLHFELQVYAGLRSRGRKEAAAEFLAGSPVRDALPDLLDRLHQRRPNPSTPRARVPGG